VRYVHSLGDRAADNRGLVLGVRGALFCPDAVVCDHVPDPEEVRAHTGHHFVLFGVPDHGRGLPAVPHEQLEVPARGGLRPDRVLHAHRAVEGDPGEGWAACAGWHQHSVPEVHPDVQPVQHIVPDHLLGSRLHLHGAPVREPGRRLRQRHRALPAEGDQLRRRGVDG